MWTVMVDALDRATLLQFVRYGLSGSAAAATHLLVLVVLTELVGAPSTLASALGFVCALPVNYGLQHRFVFNKSRQHTVFFTRYVTVTLLTLALNTFLFWALTSGLGLFYLASQIITIAIIVPLNFAVNRSFTFVDFAAQEQ
jgi:putative flippase GtrA